MEHVLKVMKRNIGETSPKSLRRKGIVPAIVYGKKINIPLGIDQHELDKNIRHGLLGKLIKFESNDPELKDRLAVCQELQISPISGRVIHVDFHAVERDVAVDTHVAIAFVGEERRKNDGSIIEHEMREVKIECLPKDIPEYITCDVSHLTSGGKILVKDLPLPPGVKMLTPADRKSVV